MSFQNVVIMGRLGKDPEVRATNGGKSIASFSVGVDDGYGENKGTEWFSVTAWEKLADIAGKFLKKGSLVAVIGTMKTRSWDKDGAKQYRTELVARELKLLDKAMSGGAGSGGSTPRAQTSQARPQAAPAARPAVDDDPFGGDEPF